MNNIHLAKQLISLAKTLVGGAWAGLLPSKGTTEFGNMPYVLTPGWKTSKIELDANQVLEPENFSLDYLDSLVRDAIPFEWGGWQGEDYNADTERYPTELIIDYDCTSKTPEEIESILDEINEYTFTTYIPFDSEYDPIAEGRVDFRIFPVNAKVENGHVIAIYRIEADSKENDIHKLQ